MEVESAIDKMKRGKAAGTEVGYIDGGGRQWRIYPLAKSAIPPLWPKMFFGYIVKKLENLVCPPSPPCVSTSGQRTFDPLFSIS